ncbi:NAD(P)H-dependent oxidoreductase [Clostridium estertheticum]|uniref:flavodoxin family protein n=1 Tax=Clostridium estertheticum TaxID=238834 RepID=UPI001C0AB3D2|nr:flavodoxin family protein [Clostridium estertheticum]MBU3199230.1 NAD(P)H-dependent oxidoreductase [Clostridium estertheticum]WAG67519.1 NAD(P)H-dependent oxidoreductase [Clostridium estertheticum]
MKIYAINGSPRKNNNTATLLKKALEGVKESVKDTEVETEIINLYDLKYTGCTSCFACKMNDGKSYGKCVIKDDLHEVLEKLSHADGIIFGSPVYFHDITGQLKSFLERLLFPYLVYDNNMTSIAPKKMPTAFIYTMNVTEKVMKEEGYLSTFNNMEFYLEKLFTKPSVMYSNDTYQFNNYSKYKVECFSEEEKAEHRKIQFPLDCEKAFELGVNLIK